MNDDDADRYWEREIDDPTRAEYLDLYLDLEIDKFKGSGPMIDSKKLLKSLTEIRTRVNWTFRDDKERKTILGKRKSPGVKPGSGRLTKQAKHFTLFRMDNPKCRRFSAYDEWCNAKEVPENERYTPGSFSDKLKREKKQKK